MLASLYDCTFFDSKPHICGSNLQQLYRASDSKSGGNTSRHKVWLAQSSTTHYTFTHRKEALALNINYWYVWRKSGLSGHTRWPFLVHIYTSAFVSSGRFGDRLGDWLEIA